MLAQDSKPVTHELDSFLSQGLSEGHGAVFVSMGTLARINRDELHSMAQALSALPNPVLWKLNPLHLPGVLRVSSLNSLPILEGSGLQTCAAPFANSV